MAYSAPTTRAAGYKVPATVWNQDVVDNVTFLANPPACRAFHSTTQSLTDNVQAALVFDSERFDTDSMHSTVSLTGRLTFNTAGLYLITLQIQIAAGTDYTMMYAGIRLNGSTFIGLQTLGTVADAAVAPTIVVSTLYKFAAAEYVDAVAYQNNSGGTARNVLSTANYSPEFSAIWVGVG